MQAKETRVIYLCSAEGKKAGRRMQKHHLPAFILLVFIAKAGVRRMPTRPLLRKGIIAANGYLAQKCALCADSQLPAFADMA